MKRKKAVQNSLLYRYRYLLASIILALLAAFICVYRFWDLPSGVSNDEMKSAVASSNISITSLLDGDGSLVNLPWSLLQCLSINLFGLSAMSLRLPAVLLTLLTIALIIWLIRRISRPNLAMMAGLLLVSSSFVISMTRSGTPAIMTTFLLALILNLGYGAMFSAGRTRWLSAIGLTIVGAALCYMVAGPYLILALVIGVLIHPCVRLAVRSNKRIFGIMLAGLLILVAPLWLSAISLFIGKTAGNNVAEIINLGNFSWSNIGNFFASLVGLHPDIVGGLVVPVVSFVGLAMAVIGLVYLLATAHSSVRSYSLVIFIVAVFVMGLFNPRFVYLLFIPIVVLQTLCLAYITDSWYGLFPNNPYARVFAILPLAVLIGSLCSTDIGRYFNAISYNKNVVYDYNRTLPQLTEYINNHSNDQLVIVPASELEQDFYAILTRKNDNVSIANVDNFKHKYIQSYLDKWASDSSNDGNQLVVIGYQPLNTPSSAELVSIGADWTSQDSVLYRIYQPADKN